MALDSLGLGLTLDTTLLEKADKTLENMQKNSKLIMQNLTRGFTAFNEDKIGNLTKPLDNVAEALDRISKAKVSPDFDTSGQDKFIDRLQQIMSMVEKMSKINGAKFFDPTEVYATEKRPDEIFAEIGELQEYKKGARELIDILDNYAQKQQSLKEIVSNTGKELIAQKKEVQDLGNAYNEAKAKQEAAFKAMQTQFKAFSTRERKKDASLTDEQLSGRFASTESMQKYIQAVTTANEQLEEAEKKLADAQEKLENKRAELIRSGQEYQFNKGVKEREEEIRLDYDNIKEREKILQKELEFSQATQAERTAMLTKKNEAEIKADQKRIRDVQKSYETLRKEIQKGEKDIAELESSRAMLKEAGRPTAGLDAQIKQRRTELNKLMQEELEFRSSQYWPKLQAIDEKFNSEAFIKNQKALAKQAAKESRKDVTAALQYSDNAQSINEEKEAVKRLIEARDNLSTSSKRYKKTIEDINKRILAHKDHIEAVTRVEKEQNTLADSVINRYRKQLKELDELNEALDKLAKKQQSTGALYTQEEMRARIDLTDRRDTVQKDILEIEKNAQGQLDVIREQHDAERAKKKVDSIIKENEREKQEYAKLLDEKYAIEKQKKAMEEAGGGVGDAAYDNLLQQEADLNARKSQLEAQHQNDLDEIRKRHEKERNNDEVKAFIEAQKEKRRVAEENAKKMKEEWEKYGVVGVPEANAAIRNNRNAENIAQHKRAIEELQKVRSRLDNTDRRYYDTLKDLNREIHSHELFIRAAENESVRLSNSHRGLMDISGQLMRRLALVFSVSQLTQYFRKLVEVRGQFEKTEVALTSIVGSQEKSNKLMNQTIALAIKSPYTLQQLTGYTKQLAAYQVEYKDLYNTTKMLADVSSGLGVEMDRLILAFGQVKAANFLRATEVRQFTEAGFNILGELAKYYTELEGTMVSVGDVQERVTKRMVDFADVEEIFKRVTSAGGMFYEMQSKQAETLAGQWTNLQDRIDVMLNEIGTSGEGILKFIVKFLASAIDNWEVLASSIKTAATAFIIFKTYSLLAGDGIKLLAIQMGVLTNSVPKVLTLGQAFKTLSRVVSSSVTRIGASMSALLTNPIFLAIAAIGALIGASLSLYRHFDKMNDALKEQSDSFNEYTSSLNKLSKEYNKLDKFTEKLAKLEELKSRLNERGLSLSVEIGEVDTDNIDAVFAESAETLQKSYDLGLSVGNAITRGINAAQGNIFGWSTLGENLAEDAEDFAAKWNKLASYGMDAQMRAMENEIEANDLATDAALQIYETIKEGRKAQYDENGKIVKYLESEYEWTMRRAKALRDIQNLDDGSVTRNRKLARYIRQVTRHEEELNHEVDNTINKLAREFDGIENLMQAAKDNPIEFSAAIQAEVDKQAWDEVTKWVYSQKLHARLDITPNYIEDPNATVDKVYKGFKKDLMDARDRLSKIADEKGAGLNYQNFFISTDEIDNMKDFSDGLEGIQKLYDENKKTIEQLEGTKGTYNKEEMARLNALQKELRAVAKLWGYDLDKDNGGKGKDEVLEKIKNQINLIKEMNREYEKLNKTFSKTESLEKVRNAYADTAKELGLDLSKMDFTDAGAIKSLEDLLGDPKYAANKYALELKKALDNFKVELGIETKQGEDEKLKNQIQELFDQYDLSLELKKLNVPTDLAKDLFGVEILNLDQLKKKTIEAFSATEMYSEEMKKLGEEMKTTFNGNVDLLNRKMIPATKLTEKGWKDAGEGIATVFSSSYGILDKAGKRTDILVTPILPDGTVLSEKELEEYIHGTLKGAEDILKADTKGIVISVGVSAENGEKLHEMQEEYYNFVKLTKEGQTQLATELNKSFADIDWNAITEIVGSDQMEVIRKRLSEIGDLADKETKEAAIKFVKFLTKNLDQTRVIMSQRGIDIAFAKKQFDEGAISAEQFAETVKNIVAQSNEEISKFNLDKFKETPEYLQAMGNLGAYTVEELRKLKESLTALISANSEAFTVEEMKVYQEVLEKVGAQIDKLDNNLWFKDEDIQKLKDIKRIEGEINDAKEAEKTLNETLTKQIAERAASEAQLSILQQQRKTAKDAGQDTTDIDAQILDVTSKITNINSEILKTEGQIKKTKTTLSELGQELETILEGETKAIAKLQASINIFNKSLALTTEVYGEIKDIAASFGADTDSGGWKQAENVFGMLQGFGSNAASAVGKFATGDIFGGIYDSVKAIFEVIKGINAIHDDALESQIQDHLDNVESLQKDYERLERAIDKAFAFERYGKVAEQTSNLAEQAQNLNKAIALEEDKKNTDPERIKELEGQIEDIENQIEDLFDNLKQELIGSFEDMGDSLASAMIEALKAGEDGIAAWNKEVDEIIAELVKKLTVQKYLEPQISAAIDTLFSRMMPKTAAAEKAAEQYGATSDEAVAAYKKAEGEIPQLDKKDAEEFKKQLELIGLSYEEFAKMIAGITGGEAGGLSALQKGIQGITEPTAQVLEAIANSSRGYLANIDSKMDLILSNMGVTPTANPQLEELINQTTILGEINAKMATMNETINGMIDSNGDVKVKAKTSLDTLVGTRASGGVGLKIVMD